MKELRVKIIDFTNNGFPGWVKCIFKDAYNNEWFFEEKIPIVTSEYLNSESKYPQDGFLGCQVVKESINSENKKIVTIDLSTPFGISEENGKTIFDVFADQLK
jgi:hypothetical protein